MNRNRLYILLLSLGVSLMAGARQIVFPFPILGGELSNSAATSVADIDSVMPRMAALGLNTVLVPAYWELMEPQEGQFDFTLIDRTIQRAHENRLKVVFLWFGAWKNSMSCYAPAWFKTDVKRFPRAQTAEGKPLEIASCFSPEVLKADNRAFEALVRHISRQDPQRLTVIMLQVENEIGMLESARDHSPLAQKVYKRERWAEQYGTDAYADEMFMARHYAQYVEHLAQTARRIMPDMPLYVNAAMNSRGRKPGQYPSAGPLAHLKDIWKRHAPSIDIMAPDIYDTGFKSWADQYAWPGNQLFIPETRCCANSGVRALYAFGEHQALGFSPFAIDQATPEETANVTRSYALIKSLAANVRAEASWGLLFDEDDRERIINDDGGVVLTCRHFFTLPWDPRATDGSAWPEGGAMLLRLGKFDYLLAGSGVVVDFKTPAEKAQEEQTTLGEDGFVESGTASGVKSSSRHLSPKGANRFKGSRLGLLSVDEVTIDPQGTITPLRRDNGDQTHQGRHARISVGDWKILHIRLYQYE